MSSGPKPGGGAREESPAPPESALPADDPGAGEGPRDASGDAPPRLGECLALTFGGARAAWSPRFLGPAWLAAAGAWSIGELLPWTDASAPGAVAVVIRAGAAALQVLLVWPALAVVAVLAAWEFGRGEHLGAWEGIRILRARWQGVFLAPLFVLGGAAVLLSILIAGALMLEAVPVVGKALVLGWLGVPGVPLALLAAGLLLLGIPALPLILAAGAIELPFPFDAAARGMSYLRSGPARYLALSIAGLLGAGAGTAVFALLVFWAIAILCVVARFVSSPAGPAFPPALGEDLRMVLYGLDLLWPFTADPAGRPDRVWMLAVAGRAVTGFALAAAGATFARTYLLLRWKVDREPPGALVRPGEDFRWLE